MNSSLVSEFRGQSSATRNSRILVVYTAAIFVSALLLFSVQPLFTKMVLPRLGGSPAVWSVAMVFFQSLLLAGYAYAHYLMALRSRIAPVAVHLTLLVLAALTLPLSIAANWGDPPATGTPFWLLGLFAVSIGLPFFALAANNPMLQAWFVRTGHPDGPDPYFLYASSNIGSFLALLSYPIVFEPVFTLRMQNFLWTGGYVLLIVLIAACGYLLLKSPPYVAPPRAATTASAPTWLLRLRWIFLAAVPSGLLVAVTAHISTDVAAAPLLWVLPLSLYLLTWVLVFQGRPLIPHQYVLLLQPLAIAGVVYLLAFGGERNLLLTLGGHQLCFFVIAMACHGELARTRPAAQHLTGFYVALSFGGMVGGLFSGLIAPYAFSWIAEYPILVVLAALCRPREEDVPPRLAWIAKWIWLLVAVALIGAIAPYVRGGAWLSFMRDHMVSLATAIAALTVVLVVMLRADRTSIAALIAIALLLVRLYPNEEGKVETVRSFFGVHKIVTNPDGAYRVLMHGTTIHGAQRLLNANRTPVQGRPEMITYYHEVGGIGGAIEAIRERKGGGLRAAVIGLGAGTLTCQQREGENWKFFEIDQSMIDTARDPKYFTFIRDCYPNIEPVVGDARLTFAKEPDGAYDLIVIDAYSSDAIPIHLATREAMEIYKRKLAPQGVVLVHVSNRHLELSSVIVGIADANGLKSWVFSEDANRDGEYIFSTTVVLSAREEADIGKLAETDTWTPTEANADRRVWTDDYSNILGAVIRRLRYGEE
ncbi:fused MFS/spermidine synthase [Bradyrhizobium sp. LHD-71]|uniref:fused MFS/spermidine synthase n=1 Tax=Bradyrhizobium sp. LHD-71 TaxID=3072141 RepID=UPI00280E4412|nr:fused MFS/spermidine synthase [Bradyrhizobium sp. LHD-71]MDQ8727829.1 fused MFS/spermidine synthase [Bradyrhizobium sp. LHD-71]